jgi:hypothetical protein
MDSRFYPQGKVGASGTGKDAGFVQAAISAPSSGPTGTGANTFGWPACLLYCTTSKTLFKNEGTLASPYWTPVNITGNRGLIGWDTDFSWNVGKAEADTAASADIGGGLKVAGQGIEVNGDSGLVITNSEAGRIGAITVTNEVNHSVFLAPLGTSPMFQPDTHGPFVVEADFTNVGDLLTRTNLIGFCGSNADALDPPATAVTVTVSFAATVGDDIAAIMMDSRLTDAAGLMCIHDKGNANATQLVTAAGVDSGKDMPAAGTYGRFRVECDALGNVRYFFNKEQISYAALALDTDEEVSPFLMLTCTDTTTKGMSVKRFTAWGVRA